MGQHAYKPQPETTEAWSPSFTADKADMAKTANDNEKRPRILDARRKRRNRLSAR